MSIKLILVGTLVCSLFLTSCKKEDPEPNTNTGLEIPTSYDGTNFETNASVQLKLINQLSALTAEAKRGRRVENTVAKEDLDNLFTASTPSLSDEVTSYFKTKLEGTNGWFDELAKASGTNWAPASPDGMSEGGVYGSYLFDENGLEIEQLIEKGQFGATLYNHAVQLMSGTVNLGTVDQLVAIFGAKPVFANSGSSNAGDDKDVALANYGARRDKNDGNGMYTQIKREFIKLQAALKAGDDYLVEKEEALNNIKVLWEKINAATVINYCHSPIAKLSQTNPTDDDKSSALHAISEGIGFIQGFKTINTAYRIISDAQIDEVLVLFNAASGETPSVYKFATDPANELSKLQQIITSLQSIYGFTDQEIEDFKSNWVAIQGR